ncbi:MAG: hypothetical protein ACX932_02085 [Gammaproteobacteria bacterium]
MFIKQLNKERRLTGLSEKEFDVDGLQARVKNFFSEKVREREAAETLKKAVQDLLNDLFNLDDETIKSLRSNIAELNILCDNNWQILPVAKKEALLALVDEIKKALENKQYEGIASSLATLADELEKCSHVNSCKRFFKSNS